MDCINDACKKIISNVHKNAYRLETPFKLCGICPLSCLLSVERKEGTRADIVMKEYFPDALVPASLLNNRYRFNFYKILAFTTVKVQ